MTRLPRHSRTRTTSREFVLTDLTPATRELFRAYRDATRDQNRAHAALTAATSAAGSIRSTLWHADQGHWTPDAEQRAHYEARLAAHAAAIATARAECDHLEAAATAAFTAARPAMEAEGYPYHWWSSGTMRIPTGP